VTNAARGRAQGARVCRGASPELRRRSTGAQPHPGIALAGSACSDDGRDRDGVSAGREPREPARPLSFQVLDASLGEGSRTVSSSRSGKTAFHWSRGRRGARSASLPSAVNGLRISPPRRWTRPLVDSNSSSLILPPAVRPPADREHPKPGSGPAAAYEYPATPAAVLITTSRWELAATLCEAATRRGTFTSPTAAFGYVSAKQRSLWGMWFGHLEGQLAYHRHHRSRRRSRWPTCRRFPGDVREEPTTWSVRRPVRQVIRAFAGERVGGWPTPPRRQ